VRRPGASALAWGATDPREDLAASLFRTRGFVPGALDRSTRGRIHSPASRRGHYLSPRTPPDGDSREATLR
jgi:hypothetical protein